MVRAMCGIQLKDIIFFADLMFMMYLSDICSCSHIWNVDNNKIVLNENVNGS